MAQYESLRSVDLPQFYLWSQFEDYIHFADTETELSATCEKFSVHFADIETELSATGEKFS